MAKIGTYENAPSPVSSEDKLIGTDSVNNDATKNFTVQEITDFVLGSIPESSDWSLTGNSGTTAGTNFIGTLDNEDFVIKTNSTERLRFGASIGIQSSTYINVLNGTNSAVVGPGYITLNSASGMAQIQQSYVTDLKTLELPNTNGLLVATVNSTAPDAAGNVVVSASLPYKVYSAIITQNGASGLSIVELQNTIGGISSITYGTNPYYYYLFGLGLFPANKTMVIHGDSVLSGADKFVRIYRGTANTVEVYGYTAGTLDHTTIQNVPIEIRVYP